MRKNAFVIYIAFFAFSLHAAPNNTDVSTVVKGNTAFAFQLYARLHSNPGNIVLSPFSISAALAMTSAGARGETARQMVQALHFPSGPDRHALFRQLETALSAGQTNIGMQLEIANSLWPQNRHPFRQEFLNLVQADYHASSTALDFINQPEQARIRINQWVEEKTRHKIIDIIPSGNLNSADRLVLVNAIYFLGTWETQFPESATHAESFYTAPGKPKQIPFMFSEANFDYWESKDLQCLVLPYKGNALQMIVLLPSMGGIRDRLFDGFSAEDKQKLQGFSISKLESALNPKNFATWTASTRNRKVRVSFPKFRISSNLSLKESLKSIGLKDAFVAGRANFSGMDGKPSWLFISSVFHKAFVEVNEKGTEAAAATTVRTKGEPPWFIADHPFLFAIRHQQTGCILLFGRVSNPAG